MGILLNVRVLIALGLAALLALSHFTAYRHGKNIARSEIANERLEANREAEKISAKRQSLADEAAKEAAKREAGIRSANAAVADSVRGLRNDLNAANRAREESAAAAAQRAAALGELLGQSAEAHREMAERCDRHVSDLRMLLEAWPR